MCGCLLIFYAAQGGDYWRLLTPGEYELTATVKNYLPLTRRVLVTNRFHEEAYVVNFELKSATSQRNWVSLTLLALLWIFLSSVQVLTTYVCDRNGMMMSLSTMS